MTAPPFETRYPLLSKWLIDGMVEIGYFDHNHSDSFIRVLDNGGLIWEYDNTPFISIDDAFTAAEEAKQRWVDQHGL